MINCEECSEDVSPVAPSGALLGPQCDCFCTGSNGNETLKFGPIGENDYLNEKCVDYLKTVNEQEAVTSETIHYSITLKFF